MKKTKTRSKILQHEQEPDLKPFLRGERYYVSFYINGQQFQRSTGETDYDNAVKAADRIYKAELEKRTTELSGRQITLEDACTEFLAHLRVKQPDGTYKGVSEGTWQMHRTMTRRMCGWKTANGNTQQRTTVPALMPPDQFLHHLTQDHVDAFVDTLEAAYSPDAFKIHFYRVKTFLKWCRSTNRRSSKKAFACPVIDMSEDYYKEDNQSIFRPPAKRDRVFTDSQVDEMLAIAKESKNPSNHTMITLLADVSIRHNEAARLEWTHVEWAKNRVWVERQKNSPSSHVELTNRLRAALENQYQVTGTGKYVFPSETSKTGHRSTKNLNWFNTIMRKLSDQPNSPENVEKYGSRLVVHSFRHTIGSIAAEHLEIQEIQKVTGHKTLKMSQHYAQLRTDNATKNMAKIRNEMEAEKQKQRAKQMQLDTDAANDQTQPIEEASTG